MSLSKLVWPWLPALLVTLGLALTGLPEHHEGPTLIDLTRKHGITLMNAVAFLLIGLGAAGLLAGACFNLDRILRTITTRPIPVLALLAQMGTGAIFLYVSGPSTVLNWWGPGWFLSSTALLGLAAVTTTGQP